MIIKGLLDLILPSSCFICNSSSKKPICDICTEKINYFDAVCSRCGKPTVVLRDSCSFCRPKKLYFDKAWAYGPYEGVLKEAILSLKYDNGIKIALQLVDMVLPKVNKELLDVDIITSVPTSFTKYVKRGYNQSELLAKAFSANLAKPYYDCLYRVRIVKDQMSLDKKDRGLNVKSAFDVKREVKDLSILLVDDVFTTGATVNECCNALKSKGVKITNVVTLAKA
ncbi:MAG: ComF family protein [Actinobacteria bacterium]|nr:MAG: ComF family protein [Actinomycetota bacterium]